MNFKEKATDYPKRFSKAVHINGNSNISLGSTLMPKLDMLLFTQILISNHVKKNAFLNSHICISVIDFAPPPTWQVKCKVDAVCLLFYYLVHTYIKTKNSASSRLLVKNRVSLKNPCIFKAFGKKQCISSVLGSN